VGSSRYVLGKLPLVMGIVNVTPDSFSDGGEYFDAQTALEQALRLVEDGADFIDVGGESTRPGSEPVTLEEELRRVVPVVEELARRTGVPISIDTTKALVARRALEAGAAIVNDVSGLRFDPEMAEVCRETGAGVVCMHMRGTPKSMQDAPHYDDVVGEICEFFRERLRALGEVGIPEERIVLDPGVGFGKTAGHNLEILSHIREFRALGRPVLIGHSRKRFLAKILGRGLDERDAGTLGVSIALAAQWVDILRVHDVRATRDALLAWRAVRDATPAGRNEI
jgi:dihydropteroate synthase